MKTKLLIKISAYTANILTSVDQVINALFGGYPDESFSGRVYRKALSGHWFWRFLQNIIDGTFFWRENHCSKSWNNERKRRSAAKVGDYL